LVLGKERVDSCVLHVEPWLLAQKHCSGDVSIDLKPIVVCLGRIAGKINVEQKKKPLKIEDNMGCE
jgi:hypothetical protein